MNYWKKINCHQQKIIVLYQSESILQAMKDFKMFVYQPIFNTLKDKNMSTEYIISWKLKGV